MKALALKVLKFFETDKVAKEVLTAVVLAGAPLLAGLLTGETALTNAGLAAAGLVILKAALHAVANSVSGAKADPPASSPAAPAPALTVVPRPTPSA